MSGQLSKMLGLHLESTQSSARKRRRGQLASPVEDLETRQLLAAEIRIVGSNNLTEAGSLTDVGGKLYFVNNNQLATFDGGAQRTILVKPGGAGFFPRELTNVGGTLFYRASTSAQFSIVELWKSDGTESGTGIVKDIRSDINGSDPGELTDVGGTLFFIANDGITGVELWKSDGTAAGTVLVKDIMPGSGSSFPSSLTNVGGTLYFRADDGTHGAELWRSDGTAAGTVMVQDTVPGPNGSFPEQITEVNGSVLYANQGLPTRGVWKSDGTNAGTGVVRAFANSGLGLPTEFTEAAGTLYFRAAPTAQGSGAELWKSDGTPIGTVMVTNIGGTGFDPRSFTDFNGTLVFKSVGSTLWKSDGTAAGTVQFGTYTSGFQGSAPIPVHKGFLYYQSNGQLLQSNGTTSVPVSGFPSLPGGPYSDSFVSVNDALYLRVSGRLAELHELSAPVVLQPATSSSSLHPTISWTAVPSATSYEVVVTDLTRQIDNFVHTTVPGTSVTPTVDFGLGQFSVSVRVATTADGQQSNWSSPRVFKNFVPVNMLPLARYQTTANPTIAWNPLQGAFLYELWINNITTGQFPYVINRNIQSTSFTPPSRLPMGVYRAWVRGSANNGIIGLYSSPIEFVVVPAPEPIGPQNSSSTFSRQPTFSWQPVTGAASYEIVVRNANTGLNVATATNIQATNWTPPADLPVGTYRWFVKAVSADGYRSNPTSLINFFIGGRTDVLTPTGTTSDRTPTFTWRPVDGADAYQVQVDRIDVPTVRVIFVTSLSPKTVFTPPTPLKPGTYRVWVRAIETFGELSPWSKAVDFTVTQSAESDRQTLVPMLAADDVPSALNDENPQRNSSRTIPVVSGEDSSVPDAETAGSTSVQPVRTPFVTTPSNAGQNPALAAASVDDNLIDRLMAGQGDSAEAMWVL